MASRGQYLYRRRGYRGSHRKPEPTYTPITTTKTIEPVKVYKCHICTDEITYDGICSSCCDIQDRITNRLLTSDEIYERVRLKIIVDVKEKSHSGYCSDPGEISISKRREILYFSVIRAFKKSDFNRRDEIDPNNPKLQYYIPPQSKCCGTSRSVYRAKLVKMPLRDLLLD
jgi:hypothetical protein